MATTAHAGIHLFAATQQREEKRVQTNSLNFFTDSNLILTIILI